METTPATDIKYNVPKTTTLHKYYANTKLTDTGGATKHEVNNKLFCNKNFFSNNSVSFGQFPDFSLTAVKFTDISKFSWDKCLLLVGMMLIRRGFC